MIFELHYTVSTIDNKTHDFHELWYMQKRPTLEFVQGHWNYIGQDFVQYIVSNLMVFVAELIVPEDTRVVFKF